MQAFIYDIGIFADKLMLFHPFKKSSDTADCGIGVLYERQ